MNEEAQSVVLDSARYLRGVRPIDPEELCDYHSGATVDAVRDLLSANALELGLIAREDGSFDAPPVRVEGPSFDAVERLPARIDARLNEILVATFGEGWAIGTSGDRLRSAIREFKRAYFADEPVTYDRLTALGYAIYHLPQAYASVQYVLDDLVADRGVPGTVRILDVGAGVGGPALGVDAYLPDRVLIDYHAVEPSEPAANLLEELTTETGHNFHCSISQAPIEAVPLEDSYDLVLVSNTLNELAAPVEFLERCGEQLERDGAIVAIEPADKTTARGLRAIERAFLERSDFDVFAPTIRLWPGTTPTDDCWSFVTQPPLAVPAVQTELDERPRADTAHRDPGTGEFCNPDVQYAYAILRQDGVRRIGYRPDRGRFRPLSAAEEAVGDRVSVAVVKLSGSLTDDVKANDLYVIGDGSQKDRWFAVEAAGTHANRHLEAAVYGEVCCIERGLVLWNADELAYNLVVDDETIVDRITADGFVPA